LSAAYSLRPWCRRELSIFPEPIEEPFVAGAPQFWRLNPVLVVELMTTIDIRRAVYLTLKGIMPDAFAHT
jgi:hypothetical protein